MLYCCQLLFLVPDRMTQRERGRDFPQPNPTDLVIMAWPSARLILLKGGLPSRTRNGEHMMRLLQAEDEGSVFPWPAAICGSTRPRELLGCVHRVPCPSTFKRRGRALMSHVTYTSLSARFLALYSKANMQYRDMTLHLDHGTAQPASKRMIALNMDHSQDVLTSADASAGWSSPNPVAAHLPRQSNPHSHISGVSHPTEVRLRTAWCRSILPAQLIPNLMHTILHFRFSQWEVVVVFSARLSQEGKKKPDPQDTSVPGPLNMKRALPHPCSQPSRRTAAGGSCPAPVPSNERPASQ
jgi:hypothetical protein